MKVANLYIGGCPIERHYLNLSDDLPLYRYSENELSGWKILPEYKISQAIENETWDTIAIQHGSSRGVRYTDPACYRFLAPLVSRVKALAKNDPKIVFNMTWVGEKEHPHHELAHFNNDAFQMYLEICNITRDLVQKTPGIDRITPTGTAVQNARSTPLAGRLSRDGYHMSLDLGRYLAGVSFYFTLTQREPFSLPWAPEGVTEEDKTWILRAVSAAAKDPFQCTRLTEEPTT